MFGIDFSPFIKPRTITGVIRADGTIYSGEGFRVSHRKGTGYYTITFNQPLGAVDPNKPPVIQIIDEPVDGPFSFPGRSFGESVGETISGIIDREGNILDGTMMENSDEYAFTVRKDPSIPGLFHVKFNPELHVTYVFTDPYSSNIHIFEVEAPQSGCCCYCSSFGNPNEPVTGQGVEIVLSNRSGFSYRTYEETTVRRRYTYLPVVFNILVIREK
ncbi:hypothetical protein [Lysinibacillus fusiformis]|uniref:hypothetical protein n=1 Tax=Lysinibacillus fusiformis TaxID=28031 RepID=UPI00148DC904|nr:hypothetical protein [Lysinibacillus fusiformis]NOG26224.1 hypothetical protein [Lysinibacillus fusiformis]